MAAAGTPDPGASAPGSEDCNTANGGGAGVDTVVPTGSRDNCVSNHGVNDMVGNLFEWVADWVPRSTACGSWNFSNDSQCLAGAATTGEPGALLRGGDFDFGSFAGGPFAGVFAVDGTAKPSFADFSVGFRCAR